MRLKNTSRYPFAEVRRLVDFATRGVNMNNVAVHVKNSASAYAGRAYCGVPCMSSAHGTGADYLVTLRIGPAATFPADNMVERVRWGGPWMTREELNAEHQKSHAEEVRARGRGRNGTEEWQLGVVSRQPYGGKRAPLIVVHDWREALVVVAAHESFHVRQFRRGSRRSEVACERFAARALDRYRASLRGGA